MHSTTNLNDNYLGSGRKLRHSIIKYGKQNHKKEILEFCNNRNELILREKEIINETLLANPICLNLGLGGSGGLMPGGFGGMVGRHKGTINMNKVLASKLKNDIDFRKYVNEKISIGLKNSPNKNTYWIGKQHTKETIEKMKQSHYGLQVGNKNSQFGTCWITNGKENKKIRKESKIPKNWKLGRTLK